MLSVVPAVALTAVAYARFVKKLSKGYQNALAEGSDVAQETLSSIRTVRSFGREEVENDRYAGKVNATFKIGVKKAIACAPRLACPAQYSFAA